MIATYSKTNIEVNPEYIKKLTKTIEVQNCGLMNLIRKDPFVSGLLGD